MDRMNCSCPPSCYSQISIENDNESLGMLALHRELLIGFRLASNAKYCCNSIQHFRAGELETLLRIVQYLVRFGNMHKVKSLKTSERNFHPRVIGLRFSTSAPHAIMPKLHYAGNNWSSPASSMAQFIHDIIRVHKWSPVFSNRLTKLCLILISIPDALPTRHLNPRTFLSQPINHVHGFPHREKLGQSYLRTPWRRPCELSWGCDWSYPLFT